MSKEEIEAHIKKVVDGFEDEVKSPHAISVFLYVVAHPGSELVAISAATGLSEAVVAECLTGLEKYIKFVDVGYFPTYAASPLMKCFNTGRPLLSSNSEFESANDFYKWFDVVEILLNTAVGPEGETLEQVIDGCKVSGVKFYQTLNSVGISWKSFQGRITMDGANIRLMRKAFPGLKPYAKLLMPAKKSKMIIYCYGE